MAIDKRDGKQLNVEDAPLCRVCGVNLLTKAEARIGVHISCVQESYRKERVRIPRMLYGTKH